MLEGASWKKAPVVTSLLTKFNVLLRSVLRRGRARRLACTKIRQEEL